MSKQAKKNITLLIGLIFTAFLCWKFTVSKTIALKSEIDQIKTNLSELPPENVLFKLKSEKKWLDSIIANNDHSNISIQNSIINEVEKVGKKNPVSLLEFSEPFIYLDKDSIQFVSFQLKVQASYENLENILYNLEKSIPGQIKSFELSKNINYKTRREYLAAEYILTYQKNKLDLK